MTNREKLREVFPRTIFIEQRVENKINALVVTDEWLDSEYKGPDERSKWIDRIYDLKEELRKEHEKYWALEAYDEAFGVSLAMDKIQKLIKDVMKEAADDKTR